MLNRAELECLISGADPPDLLALIRESRPPWTARAACRGQDPALFYPGPYASDAEAKALCAACPVREPCLAWAVDNGEAGVWGGTSARERRRMSRRGRRSQPHANPTSAHVRSHPAASTGAA